MVDQSPETIMDRSGLILEHWSEMSNLKRLIEPGPD
jgi:hypothetical protein